jgi:hypothetical protein
LKLVAGGAENLGSEIRGSLDTSNGRILGDITDFIYLDAGFTGERAFELLGKRGGLGVSAGEGADEARKLRLGESRRKMDAGDTGRDQELRKTLFTGGGAKGHTIEENLIAGSSEEKTAAAAFIQRGAQLFPGGFKLRGGAHMPELIEAGEFQQNVEAANESPRAAVSFNAHTVGRDTLPASAYHNKFLDGGKTSTAATVVAI